MITPCTGQSVGVSVGMCRLVCMVFVLSVFFIELQGDDRRHHAADPRSPDWPHRAAGHPPSLPSLHHPLHCGCFHPTVHAGDSRPHSPSSGSIQRQVRQSYHKSCAISFELHHSESINNKSYYNELKTTVCC